MRKKTIKMRTLAVMLAVFSSVAAMGQQEQTEQVVQQDQTEQTKKTEPDWLKDFTSRIVFL